MKRIPCGYCGKDFDSISGRKYCCGDCAKSAHNKQNASAAKEKRKKIHICKKCGAEFYTHSGRNSYCENCKSVSGGRVVVCGWCGKTFECSTNAKYCCKECSHEAHNKKKRDNAKLNYEREHICVMCGKPFPTRQGKNLYCDACQRGRITCPICGGHKNSDHAMCNKCKKFSHHFKCSGCGKECVGMAHTKYCEDCWPRCLVCGKRVNTNHNGCCSISCATKYKRSTTSTEALKTHLDYLMSGHYNKGNDSSINQKREKFFKDNGIDVEREFRLDNDCYKKLGTQYCYFDFRVGKFLIDINPTFTHNSSVGYRGKGNPVSPQYHRYRSLLAEKKGFHLIQIFDWDDNEKVKNWLIGLLGHRQRLYHGEIRDVDTTTAAQFCERNHLQGWCPATVWHGLYIRDTLINLMGWTYMSKKDEWHLTRFASEQGYYIAHGAEKLLYHFIDKYNPKHIVSFSDRTKHSGGLYDSLGFKCEELGKPSYWRVDTKTGIPYWRRNCQKQHMHLLPRFNHNYKYTDNKTDLFWQRSEKEIMESMGYVQVFDAGMRKHTIDL